MRKPWTLGVAIALCGGVAVAQDALIGESDLNNWDTDRDGVVNRGEVERGIEADGLYETWDIDNDERIDDSEFLAVGESDFNTWDTDDDGFLNQNEFDQGLFNDWDRDDDQVVGQDEWDHADNAGWFDQ